MAKYRVTAPDGFVYNVEGPEGATDAQLAQAVLAQFPDAGTPYKAATFSLGDTSRALGSGAVGAVKSLTDLFGADNTVSGALDSASKSLQGGMTKERKAEMERRQQKIAMAEKSGSLLEEVKAHAGAFADAPIQATASALGSFLPTIAATIGSGGAGLTPQAVRLMQMALGTGQGIGAAKGAIYDAVKDGLIAKGVDPAEAEKQARMAQEYTGANAGQLALAGGIGAAQGKFGIEGLLTKQGAQKASANVLPRAAVAGVGESIPEALQGGQERYAANVAQQKVGIDTPAMQGVLGQAVNEGLTAFAPGAGIGALRGPHAAAPINPPPGQTPPQTPEQIRAAELEAKILAARKAREDAKAQAQATANAPAKNSLFPAAQTPKPATPDVDLFGNPVQPIAPEVEPKQTKTAYRQNVKDMEAAGQARLDFNAPVADTTQTGEAVPEPKKRERAGPPIAEEMITPEFVQAYHKLSGEELGSTTQAWLKTTKGREYVSMLTQLTPEEAAAQRKKLAPAGSIHKNDIFNVLFPDGQQTTPLYTGETTNQLDTGTPEQSVAVPVQPTGRPAGAPAESAVQPAQSDGARVDASIPAAPQGNAPQGAGDATVAKSEPVQPPVPQAQPAPEQPNAPTPPAAAPVETKSEAPTAGGKPAPAPATGIPATRPTAAPQATGVSETPNGPETTKTEQAETQRPQTPATPTGVIAALENVRTQADFDTAMDNLLAVQRDTKHPEHADVADFIVKNSRHRAFENALRAAVQRGRKAQADATAKKAATSEADTDASGIEPETKQARKPAAPRKHDSHYEPIGINPRTGKVIRGPQMLLQPIDDKKAAAQLEADTKRTEKSVRGSEALSKLKSLLGDLIDEVDAETEAKSAQQELDFGETAAMSRGEGAGMPANEVKSIADAVVSKWDNAPEVVVVEDMSDPDVPEAIRKEDAAQRAGGAKGSPRGMYYKGKVYLIASSLNNGTDVVETLLHESLGHYGLRGVFGAALNNVLDEIANLRASDVEAKAAEYGLDLSDIKQRRAAAEEVLAELAQTRPTMGVVRRAIAAIRSWLRSNMPGFKDLALTDAEVIQKYIVPARQFVLGDATAEVDESDPALSRVNVAASAASPAQKAIIENSALAADKPSLMAKLTAGFKSADGISLTERFRTQAVDSAAVLERRLNEVFLGAVRSTQGLLNPMIQYRQAMDYSKLMQEYIQVGSIRKDTDTGTWVVDNKDGVPAITEIYDIAKAYADKHGMDFSSAWATLSKALEGARYNELRAMKAAGTLDVILPSDVSMMDELYALYQNTPEAAAMQDVMDRARKDMIDNMVAVGRISKATAADWMAASNYVPFDRVKNGDLDHAFSTNKRARRGLAQYGSLPQLIGSAEREVGNVMDNYVSTMGWMLGEVVKTDATKVAVRMLADLGYATPLRNVHGKDPNKIVEIMSNGSKIPFELPSAHDAMAFRGPGMVNFMGLSMLTSVSNGLRRFITAMPPFALKQVSDDIQRALITSGVQNPSRLVVEVLKTFPRLVWAEMFGKQHPIVRQYGRLGLTGEYDFSTADPSESLKQDLGFVKRPIHKAFLHRLEGVTRASDLAVRHAIYKQTMAETNDKALASVRAREFINFRRRGASNLVGAAVATIPFFNAYVQSMDVLYRAASGKSSSMGVTRAQAQKMFLVRAAYATALSMMYTLARGDDEDYKEESLRVKDSNWLLPGGFKLPVPGELAVLFKVLPERAIEYIKRYGTEEEQDAREAVATYLRFAYEQLGGRVVPIPVAVMPVIEHVTNHSFFTGRQLEGTYQQDSLASTRTNSTTSEMAKAVAKFAHDNVGVEISPIIIDNYLSRVAGSVAGMMAMATDSLINPDKLDRPMNKWFLLSNYVRDPIGVRRSDEFYDLRAEAMPAYNTMLKLEKEDVNQAVAFFEANKEMVILASYVQDALKSRAELRAARTRLQSPDGISSYPDKEERQSQIDEIRRQEIEVVSELRKLRVQVKKDLSE